MRAAVSYLTFAIAALTAMGTGVAGTTTVVTEPPSYNFPPYDGSGRSFMQIDGIRGDASDRRHPGWLQVDNVLDQCFTPGCPSGADREIIVSRHIDAFSRELGKACRLRTHFAKIVVETFLEGDNGQGWNRFTNTLNDAWIEKRSLNWPGFTEEIMVLRAARIEDSDGYDEGYFFKIVPEPRH